MTAEQLFAFLHADGDADVHVAVERCGRDVYRNFEAGRCELALCETHVALQIDDQCIDFHHDAARGARDILRDLRRLLNDPRVVAELDK